MARPLFWLLAASVSGVDIHKAFLQAYLPSTAAILQFGSGPASIPGSAPCNASDYASSGGFSPAGHASVVAAWLAAGIPLKAYEPYNEPYNNSYQGGRSPWFGDGSFSNTYGFMCETWVNVHQRLFYAAVKAAINAAGSDAKVYGGVLGSGEGYALQWAKEFYNADARAGNCTSPFNASGANVPYIDAYSFHPYPASNNNQNDLNSLFIWPGTIPTNGTSAYTFTRQTRADLNAVGGSAKALAWTEAGQNDITGISALFDASYAILGCNISSLYDLDSIVLHSFNAGSTTSPQFPIFTTTDHVNFAATTRSCSLRDITMPSVRGYKRECVFSISGNANTPGTYPVPSVICSPRLNADGTELSILYANLDLSNSHDVTFLLDVTAAGTITGRYCLPATSPGAMPSLSSVGATNTWTVTVAAGQVGVYTVPLAGGGGGLPSPPVNTAVPAISGTAQVGQTLTEDDGAWTNTPTAWDRQWQTSPAPAPTGFSDVVGAITSSFSCDGSDYDLYVRVGVRASNAGGPAAAYAYSDPVGPVIAAATGGGMPIFDSAASPPEARGAASSYTWAHTCSGSNRYLVVCVSMNGTDSTVTGATYNGVALTQLVRLTRSSIEVLEYWYLINPPTGTHNIVVTKGGTVPGRPTVCGSRSYTGVNQTTPHGSTSSANGTTATPTLTIATASDDLVVDALSAKAAVGSDSETPTSPSTGRYVATEFTTFGIVGAGSDSPGTGATVTMAYSTAPANSWILFAVPLKAAPAVFSACEHDCAGRYGYGRDRLPAHL